MPTAPRRNRRIQELAWLTACEELAEQRDNHTLTPDAYRQAVLHLREAGAPVLVLADGLGRTRASVYEMLATARRLHSTSAA